jgi:hypothetical protein
VNKLRITPINKNLEGNISKSEQKSILNLILLIFLKAPKISNYYITTSGVKGYIHGL